MIQGAFAYTIVYVPDVERTLAFYEAAFGLERRFLSDSGDYGELLTGSTTLSIAAEALAEESVGPDFARLRPDQPPSALEIAFTTDDVAGLLAQALTAGATIVLEPTEKPWGQTVAYVRDLNGLLVELCTPIGT